MARVLIASSARAGLVTPMAQIAGALRARGDAVWFLTGADFEEHVRLSGATFVGLPHDGEDGPPTRRRRDHGLGLRRLGRTVGDLVLGSIETQFSVVQDLVARLAIDVLIVEPLFAGGLILGLLPRDRRPAVLGVGLFPLPAGGADVAPFGFGLPPLEGVLNPLRNRALHALTDHVLLAGLERAIGGTVARLTGASGPGRLLDRAFAVDRYAQMTVQQFEYPRRRLPSAVRFAGPLPPPPVGPPPAWWDLRERRPIVHVTQGAGAGVDPAELIVPTIRALGGEDVLVVATTGGRDPSTVRAAYGGPLPANARVAALLPYDQVLPASSVMVTNGGYQAVQHALRFGLPLVVSGTAGDRPEVNARVEWTGTGIDLHQRRPDPGALRVAVRRVLADPGYRRSAARLGAAIAGTDALGSVLAIVDELAVPAAPGRVTPEPEPESGLAG